MLRIFSFTAFQIHIVLKLKLNYAQGGTRVTNEKEFK